MRTTYHPDSVAASRLLPLELGKVWIYAAVLAFVGAAFVYGMTQEVGFAALVVGVCVVGALTASLNVWLPTPRQ